MAARRPAAKANVSKPKSRPRPRGFCRTAPYTHQNERLQSLVEFVSLYAPYHLEVDASMPPPMLDVVDDEDVVSARNLALSAAFRAIRVIAEQI